MKAVRYNEPRNVRIETIPTPTCADGEVLLAMKACGICGTDVKTFVRGHPMIPPGSVLGHEISGVVIDTRHSGFKIGDRVVAAPYAPCLSCNMCRRNLFSLCENLFESSLEPGGFAEMIRVPKRIADQVLLKIPSHLDYVTASLTEPLACCLHGLEALDMKAGQSLLVMGDGPMGILQAALGKVLGATPVILSGMTADRLSYAAQVADLVVDVSKQDLAAELKKILPYGPEKVMVSVGNVGVVQEALNLVAKGGGVNLFAGMPKDASLSLPVNRIHYDEIAVLGTFGFGPQHFHKALEILSSGELPVMGFFTQKVNLDGVEQALEAASRFEGIKSVVVT
ncbi:MAG: alcohol dehydrogenase catalytic domain-containing protein [Chloroflexi bacterium]|nr:alcohol dehydrogenase catalytic domain-containing protein [Chloroflexota bacterium]